MDNTITMVHIWFNAGWLCWFQDQKSYQSNRLVKGTEQIESIYIMGYIISFLSQSQDSHVELHQLNQIEWFWHQIKEQNLVFQTMQKIFKSIKLMNNYSKIEFIYWFPKHFWCTKKYLEKDIVILAQTRRYYLAYNDICLTSASSATPCVFCCIMWYGLQSYCLLKRLKSTVIYENVFTKLWRS